MFGKDITHHSLWQIWVPSARCHCWPQCAWGRWSRSSPRSRGKGWSRRGRAALNRSRNRHTQLVTPCATPHLQWLKHWGIITCYQLHPFIYTVVALYLTIGRYHVTVHLNLYTNTPSLSASAVLDNVPGSTLFSNQRTGCQSKRHSPFLSPYRYQQITGTSKGVNHIRIQHYSVHHMYNSVLVLWWLAYGWIWIWNFALIQCINAKLMDDAKMMGTI